MVMIIALRVEQTFLQVYGHACTAHTMVFMLSLIIVWQNLSGWWWSGNADDGGQGL